MYSRSELAADARDRRFRRNLSSAEVRIGKPFVYEQDMFDVERGSVVYPTDLRLDWDPKVVAVGTHVLELSSDHSVVKVDGLETQSK